MRARGDRVTHPSFGPGTVRAVADGGRKLRVEFDRLPGIPYLLPVGQFEERQRERSPERPAGATEPAAPAEPR
ncbi:MAG: hypothetical protein ACUVYA_04090, partial [Planctomycetota bacterium]